MSKNTVGSMIDRHANDSPSICLKRITEKSNTYTVPEMAKFVLSHLDEGVDEDGKRQFTCRLCQFSSERKEKVRQHIESWHGDELGIRYRCDFCEKAYKCHSNLRSHVSATHKHVWSHN